MDLNKIVQKPVHGTTIEPHDGQPWSMRNEKQVLKMPGVDHPIFSVDEETEYVETKKNNNLKYKSATREIRADK